MTLASLLGALRRSGVRLFVQDGNLHLAATVELPQDVREALDTHRAAIIQMISRDAPRRQPPRRQPLAPRPLSYAQHRLWSMEQRVPERRRCVVAAGLKLPGDVDPSLLGRACRIVTGRHELLRSAIVLGPDGEPVQVPHAADAVPFAIIDLRDVGTAGVENAVAKVLRYLQRPFDLTQPPLWRSALIRTNPLTNLFVYVLHHIVCDGSSLDILERELAEAYTALAEGLVPLLPDLEFQYADHAWSERTALSGRALDSELRFWSHQLDGAPSIPSIVTDRAHPSERGIVGRTHAFSMDASPFDQLRARMTRSETPFVLLLSIFVVLVWHWSTDDRLVVATGVSNRRGSGADRLIGPYVSTLPLFIRPRREMRFRDLVASVSDVYATAIAHPDLPVEPLLDRLLGKRRGDRNHYFEVQFTLQHFTAGCRTFGSVTAERQAIAPDTIWNDLSLYMWEHAERLSGVFHYRVDLFDESTIRQMEREYRRVLELVARSPDMPLEHIRIESWRERRRHALQSHEA